ncbi:LacI family transcriptional regulator [Micromonospora sp. KC606]|uniref:LacI family DNA-binding transcriptional regulator n=1 Tax=Micromonospora sp. KC606 TaxID=2530379 RepID=UPI0010505DE3|nr:LacI family DNA-binding transcriptional regulator [Micromonospora sp. KC606]TDC83144.1 LacI family transcriptional regulator [Micromonospora sp. KC606]
MVGEAKVARVRLVDVAVRVGVSPKTVSNVVHGTGMVSDQVRRRVQAAIDELGYQPNLAARQLRNGRSGLVALAMPDLREPYFAEFASAFFRAAEERSLNVIVSQTQGRRDVEAALCEGVGLPALEGLVLSPLALTGKDLGKRRSAVPLVLIGEHGQALATPNVPHVGVDNVAAAAAATEHLLRDGRRRIAVIGVQEEGSTATSTLRFEGYRRALAAAGVQFEPALVGTVRHFNRAEGSEAAALLLTSGAEFDGLFCFNDTLAFGAVYTLATHGIRVPDQVRVVGFDAIEEGRFSVPPLASVCTNLHLTSESVLDIITGADPNRGGRQQIPFAVVDHNGSGAVRGPVRKIFAAVGEVGTG